eukprot:CAMPEP_0182881898 /NCGR_PEP_ID=MMETSP0034_2-20130328/17446_1 /TAXON_ID=156128 /ORGANISM="Nephroselmis pyriformis, Strain CCMP717" /LENGTH=355 /DNA_ID=CAMNT_0025014947 /DNA_START=1 /DNA_END=1065 /DNA_ORIENTATION=+
MPVCTTAAAAAVQAKPRPTASRSQRFGGCIKIPVLQSRPPPPRGGRNSVLRVGATSMDPEGLFKSPPSGGIIAARLQKKRMEEAGPGDVRNKIVPVPKEFAGSGIPVGEDAPGYSKAALAKRLAADFMEVDLSHPGVKVLSIEPPVLAIDGFLTGEECEGIISEVLATNSLETSKIGGGTASDAAATAMSDRRTSQSVMLDAALAARFPGVQAAVGMVHSKARGLLPGGAWDPPGRLPAPGNFCFELLQAARYEAGQHFLAHEDGFPPELAEQNGFQRHATLLCYLNDVAEGRGGCTTFQHLGLAVRPEAGKALLFFPAFRDGAPDPRTLHTAEDAGDLKWVTQQWIACGRGGAP